LATRRSHRSAPEAHLLRGKPSVIDEPRPVPQALLPTSPCGGRPRETERPQPICWNPQPHHVPDREPTRVEDQSKHGRPRTHPCPSTRPRTARRIRRTSPSTINGLDIPQRHK
jgi:hypothetical protein